MAGKTWSSGDGISFPGCTGRFLCRGCDSLRARNLEAGNRSLAATALAAPFQICGKLFLGEAIQDSFFGHAAFARHLDAPMRQIDFACRMRIGIDAHHAAKAERRFVPTPVEVKPP